LTAFLGHFCSKRRANASVWMALQPDLKLQINANVALHKNEWYALFVIKIVRKIIGIANAFSLEHFI
jgi:hypothetical protein